MKPEISKQLYALHAQCSAMLAQLEAIIESEGGGECQHEHAQDKSTMGMKPGSILYCPDCEITFSRTED